MRATLVAIVGVIITYMISPVFRSVMLTVIGLLLSLLSLTVVWFFIAMLLVGLTK